MLGIGASDVTVVEHAELQDGMDVEWPAERVAAEIAEGVAALDTSAQAAGFADYLSVGWESDRVKLLTAMEETGFFQTIRGGLITGLYNQKAVWPIFGYEGESFSQGGYIDRGFDDINWL